MRLTFAEFIEESKSAPLYHGTPFDNVHKILKDGEIKASHNGRTSMGRDRKTSETGHGAEAYFKFDQQKIAHRQQITPTDWYQGGSVPDKHRENDDVMRRNEAEESVKGSVSLKHATELVVHKRHWDKLHGPKTESEHEADAAVKDDPGIAWLFKGLHHKDRVKRAKAFNRALAKHPHIKLTVKDYSNK